MNFLIALPLLVSAVGAYMLIRVRAFFILHPISTARATLGVLRKRENRRAVILALSGTLGVGNVFGVAMGIILGGAGSLLWLTVSSLFSMVIKYSEVLLSYKSGGSAASFIRACSKRHGAFLAYLYSALCLVLSFVMGAAFQSRSIAGAIEGAYGTDRIVIAVFVVVLICICTSGGIEKIERLTEKILPLSSLIYIFMTFCVIILNFPRIPEVVCVIFRSAFSLRSAGAGIISYGLISALREGYTKGVMSNEAGIGTSTLAHARSRCECPQDAALLGILEVFIDTTVICGLSGLAILLSVPDTSAYTSGMTLVLDALAPLGSASAPALIFCVCSFAICSVICWSFYSDECRSHLFGNRFRTAFSVLFIASCAVGVFLPDALTVLISDTVILLMSFPTLLSICRSSSLISAPPLPDKKIPTALKRSGNKPSV